MEKIIAEPGISNEIIVVKQLPVIEEQLLTIKAEIKRRVDEALSLECTEETVKQIKAVRAGLSKDFAVLEEKRKEVKGKIMSPYERFEEIYKDCVTNIFKPADSQLAKKIAEVEDGLKAQKAAEILGYFNELCQSKRIDFVSYEQVGAPVTLSASKKSLKDKVKAFLDKVSDDLVMIGTQEYSAEILVEYKRTINVSQAIMTVTNRNKAIEWERAQAEAARAAREQQAASVRLVEEVIAEQRELSAPQIADEPLFVPEPRNDEGKELRQVTVINVRVEYPIEQRGVFVELCKEFKQKLIERGFRVG